MTKQEIKNNNFEIIRTFVLEMDKKVRGEDNAEELDLATQRLSIASERLSEEFPIISNLCSGYINAIRNFEPDDAQIFYTHMYRGVLSGEIINQCERFKDDKE